MIGINSITMYYGTLKSLDNVSINIKGGSIFGLIGSNGSGKSTLLRIMSGIIKPIAGEVTYDGTDVFENNTVKNTVAYLSDEQYFIPHSTINDMKKLYKAVYTDFSDNTFERMKHIFGLDCDRKLNTFSKGMKKQASVMLALSLKPKYLLCDETFDGLDPVVRQTVKRIIAEESAERGMTTVIASHNLREMEDICDTVGLLHQSELVFVRELEDMKSDVRKVQAIYDREFVPDELAALNISDIKTRGSLISFIAHGTEEKINGALAKTSPVFFECIPLTLEEIFINEMEVRGYDFSKIEY